MNFLKYILLIVFISISITATSQIISVTENDRGNARVIAENEKQIIEINSRLEVKISKKELSEVIKHQFPAFGEQLTLEDNIISLKAALRNQTAIVSILENEMATASDQRSFFEMMDSMLQKIQENSFLSNRYEELMSQFIASTAPIRGELPEPFILANFNNDLLEIKEKLSTLESKKYRVSLLAFKKDKQGGDRVHVQNFDTYTEREYVTIPRWVTSLSGEQKEQLKALAKVATENNDKMLGIFNALKVKLLAEMPSITCIDEFKTVLSNLISTTSFNALLSAQTKSDFDALLKLADQIKSTYALVKTDIGQWEITTPFDIKDQIQLLAGSFKKLDTDFKLLQLSVRSELLQPVIENFSSCYKAIKVDFNQLQKSVALLFNTQRNYIANKTIGDQVIAFTLDNLPEVGYIQLKGTGKRQNGDELLIEMVLRIPSSIKEAPEQIVTLEQRTFVMQLIGVRSETFVGLIFANPFDKADVNLTSERNFFYAPSAALLLKFGSKKSHFYNNFLDVGVGINFAAPDFNTDGTPEFGTGIITTAFKDVLSVGINYNVTLDSFYWFFGVSLPFNFPGVPINTIKKF